MPPGAFWAFATPLPWTSIGEALRTVGEFGLLVFAVVQVFLQVRGDRERLRTAYAALYAEYWRLNALDMEWQRANLVEYAANHVLYPDVLVPQDWGTLIRLMGELSSGTAALGGFAYALLNDAIIAARRLARLVADGVPSDAVRALETECKDSLAQAVLCLNDAMRAAPTWLQRHQITVVDPQSRMGKRLEEGLLAERSQAPVRRHEPRFGSLGAELGRRLASAGRWFNPAA